MAVVLNQYNRSKYLRFSNVLDVQFKDLDFVRFQNFIEICLCRFPQQTLLNVLKKTIHRRSNMKTPIASNIEQLFATQLIHSCSVVTVRNMQNDSDK